MKKQVFRTVSVVAVLFLFAVTAAAQSADLFVMKSAPATATAGTNISYTITVANSGPSDAASVSWSDTLPPNATFVSLAQNTGPTFTCSTPSVGASGGSVVCSIATLNAGDTATFNIAVNVSAGAAGTTLINTASVSSETPDPNPENNTSTSGTSISGGNLADVAVLKTGPQFAAPSTNVTFTITVSDVGPNDAQSVTLADTLEAGLTFVSLDQASRPSFNCFGGTTPCTIASLPNGASAVFLLVAQTSTTAGTFSNSASVTSANDPNPDNDTVITSVTVVGADIAVTKSGPATAVGGGPPYSYAVTLTNNGPATGLNVSFSDVLPAGITFLSITQNTGPTASCTGGSTVTCSIPALNSGASADFTLTVQPSPSVANGTTITNTATATSSTSDTNASNDTSTAVTTITTQADVSIAKSAPATATAGTNISYTITVANSGPSDAASVSWSDTLPPNATFVSLAQNTGPTFTCTTGATVTCSIATLASGASAVFTLTVNIASSTPNGTSIMNTATISSTTVDPNAANNSSSASTLVAANADLSVTKSGPATMPSNVNVTYTVTAANAGPSTASNVTLTESVPANMTFVSVNQTSGPAFTCSGTGPIVCTIASFASGASATFQFTFNVLIGVDSGTSTSNTVTISAATPDFNPANNRASVTTRMTIGQSIPALSPLALLMLVMALAVLAVIRLVARPH